MNKDERDELREEILRKLGRLRLQPDVLDTLDNYEAFGLPYSPVTGPVNKKKEVK